MFENEFHIMTGEVFAQMVEAWENGVCPGNCDQELRPEHLDGFRQCPTSLDFWRLNRDEETGEPESFCRLTQPEFCGMWN